MKSRYSILVISVIVLSAVLIATVGLYVNAALARNAGDSGLVLIVAGIIVALALAAVAMTLVVRRMRARKMAVLAPAFGDVLEAVMIQVAAANLGYLATRQLEDELIDLFAQASADDKQPEQVIGDNLNDFADRLIGAFGAKRSFWLLELTSIQYFACYMLFIQGYAYFRDNPDEYTFFQSRVDISTILLYVLAAFLTIPLAVWLYQAGQRASRPVLGGLSFVMVPILTMGLFIGFMELVVVPLAKEQAAWAVWLHDSSIRLIPNMVVLIIIILIIPGVWLLKKMIRRRLLRLN